MKNRFLIVGFFVVVLTTTKSFAQNNTNPFSNPLFFYNQDILCYQQILHKYQRYDEMMPFFYGPFTNNKKSLTAKISEEDFGYDLKRVGVKEIGANEWSITYQKIINGTKRNFKISCKQINDTCRIYLDEKSYKAIFKD